MPSLEDLKNAQVISNNEQSPENTVNITDPNFNPAKENNTVDLTAVAKPTSIPSGQVIPVEIEQIAPYKGPAAPATTILDDQMAKLDLAIERNKREIDKCIEEATSIMEEQVEKEAEIAAVEKEMEEDSDSLSSTFNELASGGDNIKRKIIIPNTNKNKETNMTENNINTTQEETVQQVVDTSTKEDTIAIETVKKETENDFSTALEVDDDEFFKDFEDDKESLDDEENEELGKKQVEMAKKAVSSNIKPIHDNKIIDFATFTISQKPVSITKALQREAAPILKKADWILWTAKRSFSMSELSGPEIEKMDIRNTNRNRINALKDLYRVFYDHIIDANKAPTFEAWLKVTPFLDVQHLYFAAYMASFGPDNAVPYTCSDTDCNEVFIQNVPFGKMVAYKDDEVKAKAEQLLNTDTTSNTDEYEVQLLQVSDEFVVALKTPSIFNVVFENAALPEADSTKYADLLSVISYIDNIYAINRETNSLEPIDTRPDHNNATKSVRNKVKAYYTILKKLTSDQYYNLAGRIKNIQDPAADITYKMPEVTCPKCGKLIPEVPQSASDLLFTRHQLVAINSI